MIWEEEADAKVDDIRAKSVETDLSVKMVEGLREVKEKVAHLRRQLRFHFKWRKKNHYYVHWIKLCERLDRFCDDTDSASFRKFAARHERHTGTSIDLVQLKILLDYAGWNARFSVINPGTENKNANAVTNRMGGSSEPTYVGFSTLDGDQLQMGIYQEVSRIFPTGDPATRMPEDKLCIEAYGDYPSSTSPFHQMDKLFWYRYFGDRATSVPMGEFVKALRFHLVHVHGTALPALYVEDQEDDHTQQMSAIHRELKSIRKIGRKFLSGGGGAASPRGEVQRSGSGNNIRDSFYKEEDAVDNEKTMDMFEAMVRELCKDPFDAGKVSDSSWARFFVMFGPLEKCFERMCGVFVLPDALQKNVRIAQWMQLSMDPHEANNYVAKDKNDKFVIRRSQTSDCYVLVYYDGQRPLNCRLKLTTRGYMLEGDPRCYDTLRRLIITVTTEKGLPQSVAEQRQAVQWHEFMHREVEAIAEETKLARFNVNTYDELAEYLLIPEEDKFRKVERKMLSLIFDPHTGTPFTEIFLQLDSDYSGALDNGEFAVGVPYVLGPPAKKWAERQLDVPLMGRLTQDITLGHIPIENFRHSLADPITKIFLLENEKSEAEIKALADKFAKDHPGRKVMNEDDVVEEALKEIREWFKQFDDASKERAQLLLGVSEIQRDVPKGFAEVVLGLFAQIVFHFIAFPVWAILFWSKQFRWFHDERPRSSIPLPPRTARNCVRFVLAGVVAVLLAGFYFLPFASLAIWRYYGTDQFVHDVSVYEIIVPIVVVVLFSFVALPLETFENLRVQRWILSKSRDAQLHDRFKSFSPFLKPTTDTGDDAAWSAPKKAPVQTKLDRIYKQSQNAAAAADLSSNTVTKPAQGIPHAPTLGVELQATKTSTYASLTDGPAGEVPVAAAADESKVDYDGRMRWILLRFWNTKTGNETREEEIIKTSISPLLPDAEHFTSVVFYALLVAAIHAVLPGVYRELESTNPTLLGVSTGIAPFFGNGWQERFCAIVHLVYGFFGAFCISVWLQNAVHYYHQQSLAMANVNFLTSARSASQNQLQVFLPLDSVESVNFWLLMREKAKEHIDLTLHAAIAVALIEALVLVVAVFVRIIILDLDIDIFAVTGLYDILLLTLHVFAIMITAVRLNKENRHSGIWLEYQKFRYSMEISQIRTETDSVPADRVTPFQIEKLRFLELKLNLVRSTMSKIARLDTPITILGLVVDQAFLVQVLAFVAAGAGSAISQLISNSRK